MYTYGVCVQSLNAQVQCIRVGLYVCSCRIRKSGGRSTRVYIHTRQFTRSLFVWLWFVCALINQSINFRLLKIRWQVRNLWIEGFSAITRYVGNYEFWENGFEDTVGCRIPCYGHICLSKMRIILIPICTELVG